MFISTPSKWSTGAHICTCDRDGVATTGGGSAVRDHENDNAERHYTAFTGVAQRFVTNNFFPCTHSVDAARNMT